MGHTEAQEPQRDLVRGKYDAYRPDGTFAETVTLTARRVREWEAKGWTFIRSYKNGGRVGGARFAT